MSSTGKHSILLLGISGYGASYVQALLDAPEAENLNLAGIVDPFPDRCERIGELRARGAVVCAEVREFYENGGTADLAILSTPIHLHAEQAIYCLHRGSHVLCEKPAAATVEQVRSMIDAADTTGRVLSIGYQWSWSDAIQNLKRDVLAGDFGRPTRFKSLVLWPRSRSYFARNQWAGRIRVGEQVVNDSPVQNATAHYLHNCFYLLGEDPLRSAHPAEVGARAFRANTIENYDTAFIRARTGDGTEILYLCSLAIREFAGPLLTYEFEDAVVTFEPDHGFNARHRNGKVRSYGDPMAEPRHRKIWRTLDAMAGVGPCLCDAEAALPHAICVEAAQSAHTETVPADRIRCTEDGPDGVVYVEGLADLMMNSYRQGELPELKW